MQTQDVRGRFACERNPKNAGLCDSWYIIVITHKQRKYYAVSEMKHALGHRYYYFATARLFTYSYISCISTLGAMTYVELRVYLNIYASVFPISEITLTARLVLSYPPKSLESSLQTNTHLLQAELIFQYSYYPNKCSR